MEKNFYVFAIAARLDYRRPDLFDFEKPDYFIHNTYYTDDRAETNTNAAEYIINKMMAPYNINGVELTWTYKCSIEGKRWDFWIYQANNTETPIGYGFLTCELLSGNGGSEMKRLSALV